METTLVASTGCSLSKEEIDEILREAVAELVLEDAMDVLPFKERVSWRIKPGFETACWSFSGDAETAGTHSIYLGDAMFGNARPGLSREQLKCYAKAYGHHERDGHGRETIRGTTAVKQLLRPGVGSKTPIPFPLFNLFEDARIEYRYRNNSYMRKVLDWRKFEPAPKFEEGEKPTPSKILFCIIQSEGDEKALEDVWLEGAVAADKALAERVMDYYRRIVATESSKALRPLMLEWLDEFPPPEQKGGGGSGDGKLGPTSESELETGYELSEKPGAKEAFDADTRDAAPPVTGGNTKPGRSVSNAQGVEDSMQTEASGSECLLAPVPLVSLDMSEVAALTKRLERAFRSPTTYTDSEDSTPDLCVENLLSPDTRASAWQRPQRSGKAARYRLAMVVDCSSSMRSGPITEARKLIAALSKLARRNVVQGFVLLTAVVGRRSLWYRMQLPVAPRDIERIHAFAGAEGIEAALRDNIVELAGCQRIFLYSDGAICDRQPDKEWLRTRGVEVIGLYCGTPEQAASLAKHTRKVIVRETPMTLADAMVKSLKTMR